MHTHSLSPRNARIIALWLFAVVIMVFVMVIIGGLTRLTHSGLSMVNWEPLTGWIPPMNEADWQALFDDYKRFPEYEKINRGMTLDGFKEIFWLEFIHRVWGRVIGVVFLLPMVFFAARGWMRGRLLWRAIGLFVLGGLQGVMGWYMVMSGLVDRPDVSQYRLTAHFGLALIIIGYALWLAHGLLVQARGASSVATMPTIARRLSWGLAVLVLVTALSGGLVAGLDAGFAFNTFPDMNGAFIPDGFLGSTPAYMSLFEDIPTVQFDHRLLAKTTLLSVLAFWLYARRLPLSLAQRRAVGGLALAAVAQVGLGIATLLLVVPVSLASLHQGGAVVLFGLALWVALDLGRKG